MRSIKKIIVKIFILSGILAFSDVRDDAILELENNNREVDRDFNIQENLGKKQQIENSNFRATNINNEATTIKNSFVFVLNKLNIIDVDNLLTPNEEYELSSIFLYKKIGINEVNELLNKFNALLIKKGYVTSRAVVNTDNIVDGELLFEIKAGRIGNVVLNDNSFLNRLKIFMGLSKINKNVLNIKDIDTLIDNFNKNNSNNFKINIEPSNKDGYSNLVATNEIKSKTILTLGYNNHGDEDGGRNRGKIGINIDSPLGLNDNLYFTYESVRKILPDRSWKVNESMLKSGEIAPNGPFPNYDSKIHGLLPKQRETQIWGGSYRILFRDYQLTLSGNKSIYRRSMYAYNTIYDLSGSSTSLKADLSKIIYRDNSSKLTTNISINRKNTKSYFEDVNLIDRNLSIGTIGLNYDFLFLKGIANIGASYSKGLRILNAENDREKGNYSQKAEAEKYNISMYWYKPIKNMTFRLMGDYQNSKNINYSTEKMTIGGIGSVPGYQYDTITGDSGYSVIGELSYIFKVKNDKLIPYISYGIGETKNNKDNSEYKHGIIKGGSLGVRYSSKYFDFDIAYAKPFSHSKYLETKDHEIYASLSLKISF